MKKSHIYTISLVLLLLFILLSGLREYISAQDIKNETNYQFIYIEQGDTLWSIASRYVPENKEIRQFIYEIKKLNNVDPSKLQPGQALKLPLDTR